MLMHQSHTVPGGGMPSSPSLLIFQTPCLSLSIPPFTQTHTRLLISTCIMASINNNNKRALESSLSDDSSAIIWDMTPKQFASWVRALPAFRQDQLFNARLLPNLIRAIDALVPTEQTVLVSADGAPSPPAKKPKVEEKRKHTSLNDPYDIWVGQADDQEVPGTFGAIAVQLTLQGLLHGMTWKNAQLQTPEATIKLATALHLAIKTKMERDFLDTTPNRIREMVCSDVSPGEFASIRRRVYDTVILGKGVSQAQEDDANVVTARAQVPDVEKFKKCKVCENNDQALFVLDRKNGDVICTNCGTVAMESVMHEGSQYRKFEGEVDRNHHGDASNPLYSNAHNMSTTLGGIQFTSNVNQGFGTQSKGLENILRNAHAYTEMNLSQFGKQAGERRTRVGYKDRQKRDAFHQMTHVGDALNLHEAVVQRAKEIFAGFRDDRELVQQFKGVIAACLCEAFDQLSRDGHRLLKLREQDTKALLENNKRANRRNELHHATMAGKGGLLLDFSHVPGAENGDSKPEAKATTAVASPQTLAIESRPASTWDLDDCRSFLLEASRNIAQQWVKDRNSGAKNIPEGSQPELEGKLVEHTMSLCDQLEAELHARDQKAGGGGKKIATPRVQDMAHLGIKWQHKHERGSGGEGGVGGSGNGAKKPSGRTAGQLLMLKTSKKLGTMLNDPVAGEAFHKELRALVGRQESRKKKAMADEATRQRLQQMKRKPWLQARAESDR